jgi:hypothetical protein
LVDGIVQGIRDRDARLAEERIQAEAAKIRKQRRREAANRAARAQLVKRAQQVSEGLVEAAVRLEVTLEMARKDFLSLCEHHRAASEFPSAVKRARSPILIGAIDRVKDFDWGRISPVLDLFLSRWVALD